MRRKLKPEADKLAAGRPPKLPPADAVDVIREASKGGASMKGFAVALATSTDTLARWLDEYPELKEAVDAGREAERRVLHDVVYQMAIAGKGKDSLLAAFMLLQNRHGYKDAQPEQGNRVNITFALPGALPMATFVEEVKPTPGGTRAIPIERN